MAQAPALPAGFELPLEPRLPRIGSIDQVAVEERAADARQALDQARDEGVRARARRPDDGPDDARGRRHARQGRGARLEGDPAGPLGPEHPVGRRASASIRTSFPTAVERLRGSGVKVASVATAFPSGQSPLETKLEEVRWVVELGADEVDMVIDRGAFLAGRYAKVYDEIVRVKEACGDTHLKVILETGELGTYDNVRRASLLAMAAGADFIKTSTGKLSSCGDAAGGARDARGDPRRLRGDGPAGRHEAGRRDPQREAGGAAPRARPRDARRGLADARPLPLRRLARS